MNLRYILTGRKPVFRRTTSVLTDDHTEPPADEPIAAEYTRRETEVIKLAIESTRTDGSVSSFARGMQLTLLNELARTIIQFGSRPRLAIKAFRRMQFICLHSMIGGNSGLPICELRSAALGTMLSRARRDALTEHCPHELAQSDAEVTEMHINALKMFYYLRSEGQDLVLARLSQWLTRDEAAELVELYNEEEIAELSAQITETWYQVR